MTKIDKQAFTVKNDRFGTDTAKGHPHGANQAGGSVFRSALFSDPNQSLWLEYVTEWGSPTDTYWLMWYSSKGNPKISVSPILGKDDLKEIGRRLVDFVQLP